MNEYGRIANIFFVRVVKCKRHSLPRNNIFLVSISASIGQTPKNDSQMSDLQNVGRFNEFLQTKCWNTFLASEDQRKICISIVHNHSGRTVTQISCINARVSLGWEIVILCQKSGKYDLRPLLHASFILAECLHLFSTIIPKWLYLSAVGIEHWPKNRSNVSLTVQYFRQNTNTHDLVTLIRKRYLFEYIKAVFKSGWRSIGDKLIHEISSARDGQLLGTCSTPICLGHLSDLLQLFFVRRRALTILHF